MESSINSIIAFMRSGNTVDSIRWQETKSKQHTT